MRMWWTLTLIAAVAGSTAALAAGAAAKAELKPTQGNTATGTVRFEQMAEGVTVSVALSGLKPNQEHGFHVHEKGDCSAPDAASAGGHFNPGGKPHGPQNADHHAGDMPALKADANGKANATFRTAALSVGAGPNDVIGRGLIVHAQPDDYTTQPTGNSGARVACAVIVKDS
jgi:Cu-Zn family superoxide dismutase